MKGVDQEVLEPLHGKSSIKLIGSRDKQDELNELVSFIEENNIPKMIKIGIWK